MDTVNDSEVDGEWRRNVSTPPVLSETESASPTSERPPNQLKLDALRRLLALDRRDKTVGTHLDELRALLKVLFELMPD